MRPRGHPCLALASALALAACNSGRDKLIADLQSNRPEERAVAVKKLAENFDADDLGLYTQAARDPVAIVRAEAMVALARSQDLRVVDLLAEALGDPDEQVQAKAALSLASIRTDKARGYLTLQYGRRSRNTRLTIVQALKGANYPGAMASVVAAEASSIWDRNLKALTDGALPERVGAAEELGRSGRPEAVNRLVPLLRDNQVVLAAAAARGLGYAGDARAVPALVALLTENFPELREATCEALTHLRAPAALPTLRSVAQENSPSSLLAVAAIIALPRAPEADKALCELALGGPGAAATAAGREMRRRGGCPVEPIVDKLRAGQGATAGLTAVIALGPTARDAAARVAPLLASSDATIRKLAADALTELGDPASGAAALKAFDAELKALEPQRLDWVPAELPAKFGRGFDPALPLPEDDPSAVVRLRTGELLRKVTALDAQRARDQGKVLLQPRPPRDLVDDASEDQLKVLASLVRLVGRLRTEGARERIAPFAREDSPSLRAAAFVAFAWLAAGEREDPEFLALAKPGLYDAERSVQAAVAQALAESAGGRELVIDAIRSLAGDRVRLLEALRGQPVPAAAQPVLLSLVREGGAEAGLAAQFLGELQPAEAVEPMLKLLDDPNAMARREVLATLGRLRDPKAAEVIGRDLYSDRADVRAAAADALGVLGAGGHLEALDALKGDYYLRVREAAEGAQKRLSPSRGAEEGTR